MRPSRGRAFRLVLALLFLAVVPRPAAAGDATAAAGLSTGLTDLDREAVAYRPPGALRGLLVLLHGAGQAPRPLVERLRPMADQRGLLLLGIKSAGVTWDVAGSAARGGDPIAMKVAARPRLGRDPARIERALQRLLAVQPIAGPVVLAGFSDGASAALSIGLAEPRRFGGVLAMSPGLVTLPAAGVMSQRIVIIHGRRDTVLPFAVSKRDIAGLLERVGYRPAFLEFDGDHRLDPPSIERALALLFDR